MTVTITAALLNTILTALNATGSPVYDAHQLPNNLIRLNIPGLPYPTDIDPTHLRHPVPANFSTIRGIGDRITTALHLAGITTWNALYTATDQQLLSLPVLNRTALAAIRSYQHTNP